ncbi:hypothetical protein ACFY8S_01400 [Streptomyces hygroscopicus]|uniref:hypothetical protein n=1 Tax=Streptomyces hygroscopicus TaxID=1912 RepID=UPI0036CA9671
MALDWYLTLGGVELANHARLNAYLESVGSSLTSAEVCRCETFTAELVGDLPYTTPEDDAAPWWDPDVPESANFAGLLVLSVEGLDTHPVQRSVTNAVTGGGAIGPARVMPRTITVTGLLLGATCCAVDYGLHWLAEVLTGCAGGGCDGDCLTLYNCCPGEEMDPEEFNARHRRSIRRVALVDGPTVTARHGDGCQAGQCQAGADILTVEFVLSAGTPWLWTDPTPVMEVAPPADDSTECVTWCLHGAPPPTYCLQVRDSCPPGAVAAPVDEGDGCGTAWPVHEEEPEIPCTGPCRLAPCADPTAHCADPSCLPPAPPVPTAPDTCFCLPLAVERECYDMDLTDRPGWSVDAPVITVRAGSADLRGLTISFYERQPGDEELSCAEIADRKRCTPHSMYHVAYVPAGGALTLDGQIGRALVECGGVCESSPDVYGRDGAPPTWRPFECASYCVCLEQDVQNPPAPDALVTFSVSGRGY